MAKFQLTEAGLEVLRDNLQLQRHAYVRKFLELLESGELSFTPGQVYETHFYHSDGCPIFAGGFCDCDTEIRVVQR